MGQATAGQAPQHPQPPYEQPPYGQYGQPAPPYEQAPYNQQPYGQQPPPYVPPPGRDSRSSSLTRFLGIAAVMLLVLGGIAYWALSQMDDPPFAIGRAGTATPIPTPTLEPTATRAPGIGINIPGPEGTPTTVTLPIPGLGSTPGLPQLPIPGFDGSPVLPTLALPGASGTQPPNAKLTADEARERVKDSLTECRLLQAQIELSQVTFEPPTWLVRLPLTGASWRVNDETGEVTPDERATERARDCRL